MKSSHVLSAAAGAALALGVDRAVRSDLVRMSRLSGSTVASPAAAAWITDFLNAAYYAKPEATRDLDDLRLAFMILTTYWNAQGPDVSGAGTIGVSDLVRFHGAFGTARFQGSGGKRGTMDNESLLNGGNKLLGEWFGAAAADWDRCGWGIAFPSIEAKAAHDPEIRLRRAKLGPLTPAVRPVEQQIWHTYPPVEVPDAAATAAAVLAVEHWPDYASELGRFTPLRDCGLAGQTFEIEVVGFPNPLTPVFIRAYVTIDTLVTAEDQSALDAWVDDVRSGFVARPHELSPIPEGAVVHAGFDLTCHQGHFMGNAKNRLVLYSDGGRSYLRAAGTWDPMPWHLAELYDRVGQLSQHAFWGMGTPEQSMLHQIALQVSRRMAVEDPVSVETGSEAAVS